MAAKVIIQLVADASGLTPGIEALEQLGQVDKATADQFKGVNKAFQDRAKSVEQTASAVDKLATAAKKLPESIIGGGISQQTRFLQDFVKSAKAGELQVNALATSISLTKKRLQELGPETKAYKQLETELKASIILNENLNKTFASSRAELRSMRETLLALEDAGLENTRTFENLATAAGQLDDQIGDTQARIKTLASDTFKFDAAIQAVQGLAGGFAVVQGAAALFGEENEEVQKTLLKVNAAMAILQGLQQIQNILQNQSAISIASQIALQKISVLQTNLQSAAESRFIVVRGAAVVAQRALNVVMAANPAGAVLFAIAALATAIVAFTRNTENAAEAQTKLNDGLKAGLEISKLYQTAITNAGEVFIAQMEAEGATEKEIRDARLANLRSLLTEQENSFKKAQANYAKANDAYRLQAAEGKKITDEEREARLQAYDLANEAAEQYFETKRALEIAELNNTRDTNKELKEETEKAAEDAKKASEKRQANIERFLRDQVAANESALIEAKGSFDKLVAEIALIESKLRLSLANPDLTKNERILAEVQANEAIRAARVKLIGELEALDTYNVAAFKKGLNEQVIARAAANQAQLESDRAAHEQRLQTIYEEQEARRRQFVQTLQFASQLANMISQVSQQSAQDQINALDSQLSQQLITQEQYDLEVRKIKRRQAKEDKDLALFQAVVNGAAAVVEALPNVFLAALAGALAAAQIAFIASRPLPAFKKGTRNAPGGPSLIAEEGPELWYSNGRMKYVSGPQIVEMNKGDKVIPTLDTQRIMSNWNIPMPTMKPIHRTYEATPEPEKIDYERMAKLIGKEISRLPFESHTWDERGYHKHQQKISNRETYLKTKYSFGKH